LPKGLAFLPQYLSQKELSPTRAIHFPDQGKEAVQPLNQEYALSLLLLPLNQLGLYRPMFMLDIGARIPQGQPDAIPFQCFLLRKRELFSQLHKHLNFHFLLLLLRKRGPFSHILQRVLHEMQKEMDAPERQQQDKQ